MFSKYNYLHVPVFYPALTGSKTPTSKFSESKEFRWGSGC
ncbi:GNAT family N-acetyltransferase, partial [Bacillus wiedmannii]